MECKASGEILKSYDGRSDIQALPVLYSLKDNFVKSGECVTEKNAISNLFDIIFRSAAIFISTLLTFSQTKKSKKNFTDNDNNGKDLKAIPTIAFEEENGKNLGCISSDKRLSTAKSEKITHTCIRYENFEPAEMIATEFFFCQWKR